MNKLTMVQLWPGPSCKQTGRNEINNSDWCLAISLLQCVIQGDHFQGTVNLSYISATFP